MPKNRHPLHLDQDTDEMKEAIAALEDSDRYFSRVSEHQLKSGEYNFYPNSGTITQDGGPKLKGKGLEKFLDLTKKRPARRMPTVTL